MPTPDAWYNWSFYWVCQAAQAANPVDRNGPLAQW